MGIMLSMGYIPFLPSRNQEVESLKLGKLCRDGSSCFFTIIDP